MVMAESLFQAWMSFRIWDNLRSSSIRTDSTRVHMRPSSFPGLPALPVSQAGRNDSTKRAQVLL